MSHVALGLPTILKGALAEGVTAAFWSGKGGAAGTSTLVFFGKGAERLSPWVASCGTVDAGVVSKKRVVTFGCSASTIRSDDLSESFAWIETVDNDAAGTVSTLTFVAGSTTLSIGSGSVPDAVLSASLRWIVIVRDCDPETM